MIRVTIKNDGKEKHSSFEAKVNEHDSTIYLHGYGADKEEALNDLKAKISLKIKELQNIDFENLTY